MFEFFVFIEDYLIEIGVIIFLFFVIGLTSLIVKKKKKKAVDSDVKTPTSNFDNNADSDTSEVIIDNPPLTQLSSEKISTLQTDKSEKITLSTEDISHSNLDINDTEKNDWSEWYELTDPAVHQILDFCRENNIIRPKIGYEIQNQESEVIGECELAWVDLKVSVLIENKNKKIMENEGWKIFTSDNFSLVKDDFLINLNNF